MDSSWSARNIPTLRFQLADKSLQTLAGFNQTLTFMVFRLKRTVISYFWNREQGLKIIIFKKKNRNWAFKRVNSQTNLVFCKYILNYCEEMK